ncbi:ankyrin repeat and LEM domain-containing protein 2 [Achroia grisella]|uniref:ankyrin repeat and LEM domain-containing protein 2 n=1 Tax=Achroia grisella TaxID=688607 RepID=UPI0027D2EAF0|nr:ankyrin repeat and LEM domain-containing protein 2 [Achroia grisella]
MSKAIVIPECKNFGGIKDEIALSPNDKKDGAIGLFSRLLRLDTLKRNSSPGSPTISEPPTTYYGVYIPCEIKKGPDEEALHVYKNKSEALELVRRYKLARFKAFQNYQDAVSFALRGAEPVDTTDGNDNSLMGEKPYPFKAPSPQDMVALRKAIEAGLATTVRDRVWENPRFLVSSGNTPAIMQEGSRYNALHVAAKSMNAEICNLILTTVGNPTFVQSLYGTDAEPQSCKEFASILVDRYLNTPDKAMNETPLHFAAKFGAEEAVDVLTSFPQCNRTAVNKYGEQPKDVICKRSSTSTPETARRISAMLQDRYYVPVLHSEDDSGAPTIGRPFTPAVPPEINVDPLSPRYEIRAFAGPMAAPEADQFRRRWKTPPRAPRGLLAPPAFRLRDLSKGLENIGRNLAEEMKIGWKEYWPFLDTFTDLRTPEGLALLENYLKSKYESACSYAYSDSCAQSHVSPDDLSLSRITLGTAQSTPIKDSMSPMSELCVALKTCKISSDRPPHWRKTDPILQRLCRQPSLKTNMPNGETPPTINHTVNQLLCIERTCQVFAKRIADALIFSLTAEPEVAGESLKGEAKHLQHTMFTYMDDERFQKIDFALIHSRLAQLVVFKLKNQTSDLDDINNLVEFLVKLRCPNDDIFSSDDERKPIPYRGLSRVKITHVIDTHVRCLASFICEELTEVEVMKGPATSEGECSEIWDKVSKCHCDWKIESFERNSKKNASFRKNRSILSTSPKSESFIRRLSFDQDIGDGKLQRNESEKPVSVNSPAGDNGATIFTVDMAKCHVVEAEISEDDSAGSCNSDECEDYLTASENSDHENELPEEPDVDMHEASDRAIAEPFIYGEEPSKMDRLVFDALCECNINVQQFPNVYRWRHTVALYSPTERDKWKTAQSADESVLSMTFCASPVAQSPRRRRFTTQASPSTPASPAARSTPCKDVRGECRTVPLQVSNWLRVTGPNSPRSAAATKNVGHNVSFGF